MKFSDFKKNIDDRIQTVIGESESSERLKNLEVILNTVNTINRSLILEDDRSPRSAGRPIPDLRRSARLESAPRHVR